MNQIRYYTQFGNKFESDILNAKDPSVWTSDMKSNGPIFQSMKKRIKDQKEYILTYFTKNEPVLDCGCGFGRQSFMLAKEGFEIVGLDSSNVFIEIAQRLFLKHNLNGKFICVPLIPHFNSI